MSRYVGLTIGPIIKTLNSARKTGELWANSYVFSYIIKNLIKGLKKDGYEFVIPFVENEVLFADENEKKLDGFNGPKGIGIFHDRFIFKMKDDEDFQKIKRRLNEKIEDIQTAISVEISTKLKKDQNKVAAYIKNYFKIYFACMDIDDGKGQNPILEMMNTLDALELREKFVFEVEEDYLENYFTNRNIQGSFLLRDAYGVNKVVLPSLPFIAMSDYSIELKKKAAELEKQQLELDDLQELTFKSVKNDLIKAKAFKKPYNYTAIVQADADNMGAMIKELWSKDYVKFKKFSETMMKFAFEAKKIIDRYNGFTLYAGGDDLLFFSPVISTIEREGKKEFNTVFHLVDEISNKFNEMFEEFNRDAEKPFTYSFGVFISYHKYPLYEALSEVRELLFGKAKGYDNKQMNRNKNAIAFELRKHSGQTIQALLSKDSDTYNTFLNVIRRYFKDEKFLTSLIMKLDQFECVIKEVLSDNNKISNFFENNFNEDIHGQTEIKDFINIVSKYISDVAKEEAKEKTINHVYSILRFVKFLNEKGE